MSTDLIELTDDLEMTHLSPTICVELVTGLTRPEDVPRKHNITEEQWARLKESKFFKHMLKDAGERFAGDIGAARRITLKSELLLEEALPVLDGIIHNVDGSTQSKIDSVKQLAVLAGRTQRQELGSGGGGAGGGFNVQIHINTGDDRVQSAPVIIEQTAD